MARYLSLWFYELELFNNDALTVPEHFLTDGRGFSNSGDFCCREN
jgi:hypothetical protein